ncbi:MULTISPECIES: hypothetical protein [Sulfurimonas]|uniref:hypothetical protein n=1 Tax=Sulfurimonas TaxID=202746 RepID=UPI0012652A08|nr:hypothetical protein [Sulfurimonas indica]
MRLQKNAIALLITILFVMLISLSIGYGLMQVQKASKTLQDEQMLYQSSIILEDVLEILRGSVELQNIANNDSRDDLFLFLSNAAYIPLTLKNLKVIVSIRSAGEKLNINALNKKNSALFSHYFQKQMIGSAYITILQECMRKNQAPNEYNNYASALFDRHPRLFRDYIASKKHLGIINDFYLQEYGDENIKNIDFDELFVYGEDNNSVIDLNYAKAAVWELMLGSSKERAEELYRGRGSYASLKDLHLSENEKLNLTKFRTTFFAPLLAVEIKIVAQKSFAEVRFYYDIKSKRGYDFAVEI